MISFNLLDNPWIPALDKDGKVRQVGLRELLVNAHQFREVTHDSPLFTASMQAICVATLQRAWRGTSFVERNREWTRLWQAKRFDGDFLDDYLDSWKDRFDLFHPRYPFYQTAGLQVKEAHPLTRLAIEENNAPAMFANTANPDWAAPPSLAAQLLVTVQNFALGFGQSSRATIGSQEVEPSHSTDGPLLRGLTIWPSGSTFFETLMLNIVPHKLNRADKPCWELDFPHELRDTITPRGRECRKIRGICDLLTLQSRLIRLLPIQRGGKVVVPGAYFTQGRSLPKTNPPSLHPLKLYVISKSRGVVPLSLGENKAIWRSAATLFNRKNRQSDKLNPLTFVAKQTKAAVLEEGFRTNLNVVGMATAPGKAGKILLWRHDRLPLPLALFVDPKFGGAIQNAIDEAEMLAEDMRRRFALVAKTVILPETLTRSSFSPEPEDVKNLFARFDPRRAFWPRLEAHFVTLLKELPEDAQSAHKNWRRSIELAANDCFAASCRALGNGPAVVVALSQVYPLFSVPQILAFAEKNKAKATNANGEVLT